MSTISVVVPQERSAPRGAEFVAVLFDAVRSLIARRKNTAADKAMQDAELVRREARELYATNPGLAADLFAAADRHVSAH